MMMIAVDLTWSKDYDELLIDLLDVLKWNRKMFFWYLKNPFSIFTFNWEIGIGRVLFIGGYNILYENIVYP